MQSPTASACRAGCKAKLWGAQQCSTGEPRSPGDLLISMLSCPGGSTIVSRQPAHISVGLLSLSLLLKISCFLLCVSNSKLPERGPSGAVGIQPVWNCSESKALAELDPGARLLSLSTVSSCLRVGDSQLWSGQLIMVSQHWNP